MDNQSFRPRPRPAPRKVADPFASPDDDELEAVEEDDSEQPAPARQLPKKFLYPSEEAPSFKKQYHQPTDPSSDSPPSADPDEPSPNVYGRSKMTDQSLMPRASKALPKNLADPSADAVPYSQPASDKAPSEQTTVSLDHPPLILLFQDLRHRPQRRRRVP